MHGIEITRSTPTRPRSAPVPRVLVLRTAGTNCDLETAHAFELAGAETERLHVGVLVDRARRLDEFDILALPGGFSYGDDLGAGTILANQLRCSLRGAIEDFLAAGRLVIGICNGFQVLVRLGVLPGAPGGGIGEKTVALVENTSGLFEDRWVRLRADTDRSPMLRRGEVIRLPVAHREGRLVVRDPGVLEALEANGQIALRYVAAPWAGTHGEAGGAADPSDPGYPANPNGSVAAIAGLVSPCGNVLGMMPHPERFLRLLHDPSWTRRRARDAAEEPPAGDWRLGDGYRIFERAVERARELVASR